MVTKIIFAHASVGCYACKMLRPRFTALMEQKKFKNIKWLDVTDDEQFDEAEKYHVRNIPTVIFLDVNEEIGREVGNLPDEEYLKYFEDNGTAVEQ